MSSNRIRNVRISFVTKYIVDEVIADLMSSRPRMGRRSSLAGDNQVRQW